MLICPAFQAGTIVAQSPAKTDINIWYINVSFEIKHRNNVPVDDLKMIAAGNVSIIPKIHLKLKEVWTLSYE